MAQAPLLKIPECARRCSVANITIRRAIERGALPVVRFGSAIRVRESDLNRFILEHSKPPARNASA